MAYVNNVKLQEIRNAARNGNEKAAMVLQALRKRESQEDLDRLVNGYYSIDEQVIDEPEIPQNVENAAMEKQEVEPVEEPTIEAEVPVEQINEVPENQVTDISDLLDKDMDGLLVENELSDLSFNDFLKNKSNDYNKMRKNADYFKAYDADGRQNYMNSKIEKYNNKFNGKRKDINRRYDDIAKSIGIYNQGVNDLLDDDFEFDTDQSAKAYKDFTSNEDVMSSFGRHWDDQDNNVIIQALTDLAKNYGKKNVSAMISTLGADNNSYKDYLNNQIDSEVGRYSKDIEKLLK